MSELQRIVDGLARATRCAVSVHDRGRRLLAFSSHEGTIDEVRKESILSRRGPSRGYEWARSFGIERQRTPVRIPSNPEIGMDARVCAPIRFDDRLLGFLWLVDPGGALPDESIPLISSAAEAAALAIRQDELVEEMDRGRERALLRDLLSEEGGVRTRALTELVETGLLVASELCAAVVVRPVRDGATMSAADTAVRTRLEQALARGSTHIAPRHSLSLVRQDHGVLLVTFASHQSGGLDELGEEIAGHVDEALRAEPAWRTVVGIGGPQSDLACAHRSYEQALRTAASCEPLGRGPVAKWDDLGVYRMLLQLSLADARMDVLHPGLARLFATRDAEVWTETLERYLDLGCDARESARSLYINRSSLYHRIHRIEEIAGVDLSSGDDRLGLHLGLKVARLAGLLPTRVAPA